MENKKHPVPADVSTKPKRVAILAGDGFEETELTSPLQALQNSGASVEVLSLERGDIQAFKHHDKSIKINVDRTLDEASPDEFDALVLPGGALNADTLRIEPKVQRFVKSFIESGKPTAVICHAPWILASAGLAKGRKLTSYHTIQDDLRNAGAQWVDEQVVVDGNLVTSRQPDDLPAFNRELLKLLGVGAEKKGAAA
ncbi:MAG: type 1 glutamine amidotransferase [Deltaproteobacteria bacterium]|nr:type 1 glutamine amidotransferase [Deltaproteobacteria bacterium]